MNASLKKYFIVEIESSKTAWAAGNIQVNWRHLERAHILSQAYAWPHIYVHWLMLTVAIRQKNIKEIAGQIIRLLVAGPGTLSGRAPLGNTGGANVGILQPMPIPPDLQAILDKDNLN